MNFDETEIQSEIRSLTRKFAQSEILPQIQKDESDERFRPEWIEKLGELGLTGLPLPEEFGGAGMGYQEHCIVIEELARASCTYAVSVAVSGLAQQIILAYGSSEQKKKYLPRLASGKAIGSFSLSEAGSGSDASSLRTTAKKDGGEYVLNGAKLWTTQADVAEVILLMARTGDSGAGGISTFILEKDTPGMKMGKRENKMGMKSSHTMEVVLDNARIPASQLVGNEGDGFKYSINPLNGGRITIAAAALGVAKASLEVAADHAAQREQFGRRIGEFQGVSFMIADMATSIDASELLIRRAAYRKDQGLPFAKQAAMAKCFATDAAMKVSTDAVQILGGSGYTVEFPVERYMREAKVLQIVEGTNQIQRSTVGRLVIEKKEL